MSRKAQPNVAGMSRRSQNRKARDPCEEELQAMKPCEPSGVKHRIEGRFCSVPNYLRLLPIEGGRS